MSYAAMLSPALVVLSDPNPEYAPLLDIASASESGSMLVPEWS